MDINKINNAKESINSYLQKYIGEKEPVIVKKLKGVNAEGVSEEVIYVAIGLTASQLLEAKESNELPKDVLQNLLKRKIILREEQETKVLFIGDLNTFKEYEKLVYCFPLRRGEEPVFRNYVTTKEKQLAMFGSINVCNSARKSWESVILKTGYKNGVVIKVINQDGSTV